MGAPRPGRLELGAEGHEQENRQVPGAVDHEAEKIEGRGIDPMDVLDHHQHGRLLGSRLDDAADDVEDALFQFLGFEGERRVPAARRQRQEGRQQGCHLGHREPETAERRLDLVEPLWRPVGGVEAELPPQLLDHRMQGAVPVIGRRVVEDAAHGFAFQALAQPVRDARLAEPGLAGEQDHLSLAIPSLGPAS